MGALSMNSSSATSSASSSSTTNLSDFNHQILKGLTAGVLAAAISKSAVAPMDRVKLVLQVCLLLQYSHKWPTQSSAHFFSFKVCPLGKVAKWQPSNAMHIIITLTKAFWTVSGGFVPNRVSAPFGAAIPQPSFAASRIRH
jgi:hypothetical protein